MVHIIVGEEVLLDDEAVTVGGTNHSHATQDLQEAIAAGEYPEWRLFIQVRPPALPCALRTCVILLQPHDIL